MILLPNLLKRREQKNNIQAFTFQNEYEEALLRVRAKKKTKEPEEELSSSEVFAQVQQETKPTVSYEELKAWEKRLEEERQRNQEQAQQLVSQAKEEANALLEKAKEEAEQVREDAKQAGYDAGYAVGEEEGYQEAYNKVEETVGVEAQAFLQELKQSLEDITKQKEDVLYQYKNDLKDVAIAIAEKVVQVSLRSSGEIIERMIISATERLKTKEWVKIYISKSDAQMMLQADRDLVASLSHLSEHIKVIVMNDEKQGTCIIECPDEIIDASVNAQMENIKEILNQSGT